MCPFPGSPGDVVVQQGDNPSRPGVQVSLRALHALVGSQGNAESDQGSVGSPHSDGIGNQVELSGVFARDCAVVRPIPIKDKLPFLALGNQVSIGLEGLVSGNINRHPVRFDRRPTRPRQAIFR